MRIGLVIYGSLQTTSGGYLYDRQLIARLQERGDHVRLHSLPRRGYVGNFLDNLTYRNPMDVDVVLQDELNHPSLLVANRRPRRNTVVAIVHHLRSDERRSAGANALIRRIERRYLNSVDGFVFNSETTKARVQRHLRQAKPCVVATPGGDRLGSTPPDYIRGRASEAGPLRALFVGALTAQKGLGVLLDAMEALPDGICQLRIVGSDAVAPAFAQSMRQRASALKLSIEFCGELGADELAAELTRAQALVLPSYYEGFGISLLEGMAHGLATVSTRAGAVPELVRDGITGFLVEPGDAAAIAARLEHLSRDRDLLTRLGLAASQAFKDYPTWAQTTDRIRDFLLSFPGRH